MEIDFPRSRSDSRICCILRLALLALTIVITTKVTCRPFFHATVNDFPPALLALPPPLPLTRGWTMVVPTMNNQVKNRGKEKARGWP